jgi:hypothetical protein
MNILIITLLIIVCLSSIASSLFCAYIFYKMWVKEKIIKEPEMLKQKKEVVVFKWNVYWENFLADLKNW